MSETFEDPVVAPARIRYEGDQPYSLDYHDIYHAADGAAEVARVFVGPCRLDELARQRGKNPPLEATVRVGELGFGSGLNFVVAAERCLAAGAQLHFISCEASPIDAADFAAIAACRASAHPLYTELAAAYPPRIRGWHQRFLAGGRIRLMLWLGGAQAGLADLCGRQRQPVDAWFLDGFAPDRNPALWEPALFRDLAALSSCGTRVATFTAAGRVRRGLEAAGFTMARVDQRPHKRESLAGTFAGAGLSSFHPPARVTVVGGGLAGASTARQLAEAGCQVTLIDAGESTTADAWPTGDPVIRPASSMPATVLHARLLAGATPTALLRCHGYLFACAVVPGLPGFQATGVLQLAGAGQPPVKLADLASHYAASGSWLRWLEPAEAAELADWPVTEGGLHLPAAGVVDIPVMVEALKRHANVEVVRAHRLQQSHAGSARRRERELASEGEPGKPLVLACGASTRTFPAAGYLEIAAVHGQLDFVAAEAAPRLPLVGRGYLVPGGNGLLAVGSTYEYQPWDPQAASRANLAQLAGHRYRWRYRCRGTRSVSSDRTAVAGPLFDPDGRAVPDLYVTTGHGSAGNVSTHLAAALLTAHITGDCPPLQRCLEAALSPLRFRERQARRGYRHNARD